MVRNPSIRRSIFALLLIISLGLLLLLAPSPLSAYDSTCCAAPPLIVSPSTAYDSTTSASHVNSSSFSSVSTYTSTTTRLVPLSPPPEPAPPQAQLSAVSTQQGCNIFRGEWVPDPSGPRYTNQSCPFIQDHQNCIKYGRPDTGFLNWRWRPDGCDLLPFDPSAFLSIVRDKTLAFIGDSLARNHMQSLLCLLSQVERPYEIPGSADEDGMVRWRFPGSNFTITIFWSPFLVNAHKLDKEGYSWDVYLDEPDEAWASRLAGFDLVLLSTGNWFTRPATFYVKRRRVGCHYCYKRSINKNGLYYSHKTALRTALRFINRHRGFAGRLILRTVSPSHFEGGEWNKGGDCRRTAPFGRHEWWWGLQGVDAEFYSAQLREFRREAGDAAGRRMVLMDATGALAMRPDGHPSRYGHRPGDRVTLYNDCVHWCLPGPIDALNDMLLHTLLSRHHQQL